MLLSQVHRARALALLERFLDLGSWAVDLALSVGIFPYVLKLLQTSSPDLRNTLVFIWTKILALDSSCQVLALMASRVVYAVPLWHVIHMQQLARNSIFGHEAKFNMVLDHLEKLEKLTVRGKTIASCPPRLAMLSGVR